MEPPRCMSSQHPDNVNNPFFVENSVIEGEDEIKEAYYAFSHLGCDEQMWDCEGKEVDNYVVKKLLTQYEDFFKEHVLGEDLFLTLRIPNPSVEKSEAKTLVETLNGIPRSFDLTKLFYGRDVAPIFEVIIPMTTNADDLNKIYHYYKEFIIGKENMSFFKNKLTVKEWLGEFKPKEINIIPLVEDKHSMINSDKIVREYLKDKKVEYQRVFLARSDPALNYGMICAILSNKIATQKLHDLSKELSIEMYPIIGVGSAPFRGNLTPENVENCLRGYPSVQTFTLQSAFKFDYPPKKVAEAVEKLKHSKRGKPVVVEEEKALAILEKHCKEYQKHIPQIAPIVNQLAEYIPPRRKRKLHIGLFGYSREASGITLPRAIRFCACLYSIGLPPELIGLNALTEKELDYLKDVYLSFDEDFKSALRFFNPKSLELFPEPFKKDYLKSIQIVGEVETNKKHEKITNKIIEDYKKQHLLTLYQSIIEAASVRNFLG